MDLNNPTMHVVLPPTDRTFFVGVDLGQRGSHTAIVVVERFDEQPEFNDMLRGQGPRRRYIVRQAERIPLGTPYSDVIARLKQMSQRIAQHGPCIVVVDESGGGIPVVEAMKKELDCRIIPIMITSGSVATGPTVPRDVLITKLQVMVEREELEIAFNCRDIEPLYRELAHLTLGRKGSNSDEHDDLALALSLGVWRAKVR